MEPICIVTDSSVQFPKPVFPGRDLVKVVPLSAQLNAKLIGEHDFRVTDLPLSAPNTLGPRLAAPEVEELREYFANLCKSYHQVIGIFLSAGLSNCVHNARQAVQSQQGNLPVQIIDSQTTSIGLGVLVQDAAQTALKTGRLSEVEHTVRALIPHSYGVFCVPSTSYLHFNGFLDPAQAGVSEMLGLYPIFNLENGQLTPVEKMRHPRQVIDHFIEYMDEFDRLYHIAVMQGVNSSSQDIQFLRDHVSEFFPRTPFTGHMINPPLAVLFGPTCTALFLVENMDRK